MPGRLERWFYLLMRIDRFRFIFCRLRWRLLKRKLQFHPNADKAVGEDTVRYNLGAFDHLAVFGMGKRMSLLLFPTAAIFKDNLPQRKVLVVGPRTEDDVLWARSLGLFNTEGLDLFSYSPLIRIGDIHNSGLPDQSYDAVLLGWMISYSSNPHLVIEECLRMLKPGGLLAIGIESNARQKYEGVKPPRMNSLNSPADLAELVGLPMIFNNDPLEEVTYDCAAIFKKLPKPEMARS
jgi:SAM-dependent methyltransferase